MQKQLTLLLLALLALTSLIAQNQNYFEKDIRAFERLDSIEQPAKGQVLLYGSSTMQLWTTYKTDLAGYNVVNRGFGGSEMSDAVFFFDHLLLTPEGRPNGEYLVEDKLHMNAKGYAVWTKVMRDFLKKQGL